MIADYPEVPGPGSHPPAELDISGHFAALIDELRGPQFQAAVERKFDIDLTGRPTMYTVRGFVREKDGSIHTDSETKIITVLLYMNEDLARGRRPPAPAALGDRSRRLRRRSAAERRHAARFPPLRPLLARPQADLRGRARDPIELGDQPGRRRSRARPPSHLDKAQEIPQFVHAEFSGVKASSTAQAARAMSSHANKLGGSQ